MKNDKQTYIQQFELNDDDLYCDQNIQEIEYDDFKSWEEKKRSQHMMTLEKAQLVNVTSSSKQDSARLTLESSNVNRLRLKAGELYSLMLCKEEKNNCHSLTFLEACPPHKVCFGRRGIQKYGCPTKVPLFGIPYIGTFGHDNFSLLGAVPTLHDIRYSYILAGAISKCYSQWQVALEYESTAAVDSAGPKKSRRNGYWCPGIYWRDVGWLDTWDSVMVESVRLILQRWSRVYSFSSTTCCTCEKSEHEIVHCLHTGENKST